MNFMNDKKHRTRIRQLNGEPAEVGTKTYECLLKGANYVCCMRLYLDNDIWLNNTHKIN